MKTRNSRDFFDNLRFVIYGKEKKCIPVLRRMGKLQANKKDAELYDDLLFPIYRVANPTRPK